MSGFKSHGSCLACYVSQRISWPFENSRNTAVYSMEAATSHVALELFLALKLFEMHKGAVLQGFRGILQQCEMACVSRLMCTVASVKIVGL